MALRQVDCPALAYLLTVQRLVPNTTAPGMLDRWEAHPHRRTADALGAPLAVGGLHGSCTSPRRSFFKMRSRCPATEFVRVLIGRGASRGWFALEVRRGNHRGWRPPQAGRRWTPNSGEECREDVQTGLGDRDVVVG